MAFPTTAVIDNFNRTEDPLSQGGAWTSPMVSGSDPLETNGTICQNLSLHADAYRTTASAADCEIYCTIAQVGATGDRLYLWLRIQDPTLSTQDDYTLTLDKEAGTDVVRFYRGDDLAGTQLGADVSIEVSAGHKLGFEAIGSTLAAYHHNGTSWSQLATRTDSTYGAGHIGFGLTDSSGSAWQIDDVGGGDVVSGGGFSAACATQANVLMVT